MINKSNIFLYLGTFFSQCLTLITSIIVLKFISPEEYGYFSYIIALGSVIGSISTLKFEQSISISNKIEDSIKGIRLTIQTCFLLSIFIIPFIVLLFDISLFQVFWILLLSISISIFASLQQFYLYKRKHKLNGLLTISVSLLNILFLLFLYKFQNGLIYSYVLSYFLSNLIFLIITELFFNKLGLFNLKHYMSEFKTLIFFPISVLPASIVSILILYGNTILLNFIYDEKDVGIFTFTIRILTLPVILISSVSSGIFKTRLANFYHKNDLINMNIEKNKMLKFILITLIVIFPILVITIINLNKFISIGEWNIIDSIVYILVFYACSQYILIPFQSIPIIFNNKRILIFSNTILLLGLICIYLITYFKNISFVNFLIIYTVFNFLFSIFAVLYYYNLKSNEIFGKFHK